MILSLFRPFVSFLAILIFGLSSINADPFMFLCPDSEVNALARSQSAVAIGAMRFETYDGRILVDPTGPKDWSWIAAKDIPHPEGSVSFFFWNGIIYTHERDIRFSTYRIQRFTYNFTDRIISNGFVLGFYRPREALIFVATDQAMTVDIHVDEEVFGEPVKLEVPLSTGESRLLRFFLDEEPYRP